MCHRLAALAELAEANGLPRGATRYAVVDSVEMFMFNYPQVRFSASLFPPP